MLALQTPDWKSYNYQILEVEQATEPRSKTTNEVKRGRGCSSRVGRDSHHIPSGICGFCTCYAQNSARDRRHNWPPPKKNPAWPWEPATTHDFKTVLCGNLPGGQAAQACSNYQKKPQRSPLSSQDLHNFYLSAWTRRCIWFLPEQQTLPLLFQTLPFLFPLLTCGHLKHSLPSVCWSGMAEEKAFGVPYSSIAFYVIIFSASGWLTAERKKTNTGCPVSCVFFQVQVHSLCIRSEF